MLCTLRLDDTLPAWPPLRLPEEGEEYRPGAEGPGLGLAGRELLGEVPLLPALLPQADRGGPPGGPALPPTLLPVLLPLALLPLCANTSCRARTAPPLPPALSYTSACWRWNALRGSACASPLASSYSAPRCLSGGPDPTCMVARSYREGPTATGPSRLEATAVRAVPPPRSDLWRCISAIKFRNLSSADSGCVELLEGSSCCCDIRTSAGCCCWNWAEEECCCCCCCGLLSPARPALPTSSPNSYSLPPRL